MRNGFVLGAAICVMAAAVASTHSSRLAAYFLRNRNHPPRRC